jgi:hypothetical protein
MTQTVCYPLGLFSAMRAVEFNLNLVEVAGHRRNKT